LGRIEHVHQLAAGQPGTEKFSVVGSEFSNGLLNTMPGKAARSASARRAR
jgi:hypothetical protein